MSHRFPSVEVNGNRLSIRFLDGDVARSIEVECVIDQADFGDVIGVEILDLRRQLSGGRINAPGASGSLRWSYDSEMDAFYVHVREGRSQVQQSGKAQIGLDSAQRIVRLDVAVPPPSR